MKIKQTDGYAIRISNVVNKCTKRYFLLVAKVYKNK